MKAVLLHVRVNLEESVWDSLTDIPFFFMFMYKTFLCLDKVYVFMSVCSYMMHMIRV